MDLGLTRMEEALARMCHISYPIVQVLGTNGKGSTCAFLCSAAMANGLNCGLFTSPHFLSPRERILFNGKSFPEDAWLAAARDLASALGNSLGDLTYFEFLTLLAVALFRRAKVDLAIFEAGLGGAHDATSALPVRAQCYTPIALDHEAVLGRGLAAIARDKAQAMRPHIPVFSAPQYPAAREELEIMAAERLAPLTFAAALPHGTSLGLAGDHQLVNAGVARSCWHWLAEACQWQDEEGRTAAGLAQAFVPGRMQILPEDREHGKVILDGAHNCHGMQELLRQLALRPQAVIFSALKDKDWRPSLAMLGRLKVPVITVQLPGERAEKASLLAEALPGSVPVEGPEPLRRALQMAPSPVLICGSLYLLAEFYNLFPQYLEKTD